MRRAHGREIDCKPSFRQPPDQMLRYGKHARRRSAEPRRALIGGGGKARDPDRVFGAGAKAELLPAAD